MLGLVDRSLLRRYQICNEAQARLFEHVLLKHAFFNNMICVQLSAFNSNPYGRTPSPAHNSNDMFASTCSFIKNDPLCMAYHPYHFVGEVLLHPVYIQCVWLILSRKFSSSPAGRKLRVWRQASRAGGGVFTDVNWLKFRYILQIMIWYSPCSQKMLYVLSIFLYARFTPFQKIVVHTH